MTDRLFSLEHLESVMQSEDCSELAPKWLVQQLIETMRENEQLKKRLGMAHPDFDNTYVSPLKSNKDTEEK